jgi:predicted nucleic acid-binding protein
MVVTAALDISLTYGTTVYDGCYVALAQRLAIPCVTADKKLVSLFANRPGFQIYWLGDFLKPG